MNLRFLLAVALALPLAACQSLLSDIQKCERHYNGTVSGGTLTPAVLAGSALVDCCPVGYVSTPDHKGCEQTATQPLAGALIGNPAPKP